MKWLCLFGHKWRMLWDTYKSYTIPLRYLHYTTYCERCWLQQERAIDALGGMVLSETKYEDT